MMSLFLCSASLSTILPLLLQVYDEPPLVLCQPLHILPYCSRCMMSLLLSSASLSTILPCSSASCLAFL